MDVVVLHSYGFGYKRSRKFKSSITGGYTPYGRVKFTLFLESNFKILKASRIILYEILATTEQISILYISRIKKDHSEILIFIYHQFCQAIAENNLCNRGMVFHLLSY